MSASLTHSQELRNPSNTHVGPNHTLVLDVPLPPPPTVFPRENSTEPNAQELKACLITDEVHAPPPEDSFFRKLFFSHKRVPCHDQTNCSPLALSLIEHHELQNTCSLALSRLAPPKQSQKRVAPCGSRQPVPWTLPWPFLLHPPSTPSQLQCPFYMLRSRFHTTCPR